MNKYQVAYSYKEMLSCFERGRHSDKWHNIDELGELCANKNKSKGNTMVVSLTLGARTSQTLRKKAEELLGEGKLIQHGAESFL